MKSLLFIVARFREDKKEAISKNFILLTEQLAAKGYCIDTITPVKFDTSAQIEQSSLRQNSRYASLFEALINLIKACRTANKKHSIKKYESVSLHIATPIELLIASIFLSPSIREITRVSIWQAYMSYGEVRLYYKFYIRNFLKYFHLIFFNSFITAIIHRCMRKNFSALIVHNQYQKKQLEKVSNEDIFFINNGIFSRDIEFPVRTYEKKLKLLYIGHSKPSKGTDVLIKLISVLKSRSLIDFKITMCLSGFGDDDLLRMLVRQYDLNDVIKFKYNIDVYEEMLEADILLLPLRTCIGTTLQPNLIVEAMAAALPVAIPYFYQLESLISFSENAIEINLEDIEWSVQNIEKAYNNSLLMGMSKKQFDKFINQHTLEQFILNYENALGVAQ